MHPALRRTPPCTALGRARLTALASAVACAALAPLAAGAPVQFDRDVRPILSDKCFFCHGPDESRREADLRLDTRDGLLASVVVPGDPAASPLVARIFSADESERMPPAETRLALSEEEKSLLKRWIAEGAPYAEHWSFQPLPRQVAVPELSSNDAALSEIDRFVRARLESEGLAPTERAEPLRILRRVTLDLTGLPPTSAAIDRFAQAAATDFDQALAAEVDRLLASPAFGEHLAVAWLDATRYADSFGYQADELNTQWPYRDWVVRAFNDNLPYDQFLTWQLAGDLLPEPTDDQILATAFNRLHRMTSEGGSIAEEWLAENAADRVQTFGSAVLGLTLECARCHDHKYDPILTRDFYSLAAFFNSIDENGMYDHPLKVPTPSLLLATGQQRADLARARRRVAAAEQALAAARAAAKPRFRAWLAAAAAHAATPDAVEFVRELPDVVGHYAFDGPVAAIENLAGEQKLAGSAPGLISVPGRRGQAIRCDGDHGAVFKDLLPVDRCDAFTIDCWIRDDAAATLPCVLAHRSFGTDVGYNGYDLTLAGGYLRSRFYRVWPGNGIGVVAQTPLAPGAWQHITATYDGSGRARGLRLYVNGVEATTTVERDQLVKSAATPIDGSGQFTLGERMRDRGFKDGQFDDLTVATRALAPLEVARLHAVQSGDPLPALPHADADQAFELYLSAYDADARQAAAALRQARQHLVDVEDQIHEVSVMRDLPEPRPTYVLARGAYDAPKTDETRVSRDVFQQILGSFPPDAPRNRLGLARWLTRPDHPLAARVAVNRIWANFFEQGLAPTPDNFGRQGVAPAHPELLDWLARDFVDHGWDVKRLCRQIIASATYQQDSRADADARQRDPDNALLARGPSRRLSAEQLRDLALAASDLLVSDVGGPPQSPYQPGDDLWQESNSMSPPYRQSTGAGLHRRSLYSVWKRTAPLPNMLIFDATAREVCTVKRGRTNTPLQALVLLNDVQFVEASRALAQRAARAGDEPSVQIAEAFRRLTGRPPEPAELEQLTALYDEQRALFDQNSAARSQDAEKLLAVGDSVRDDAVPPASAAALTVVCQTILNLDAAIYER